MEVAHVTKKKEFPDWPDGPPVPPKPPKPKTERELLERVVVLLEDIKENLNMSEVADKLNARFDTIEQTLATEKEEILAAIEAAKAGDATPEEIAALEARADGVVAAIAALVTPAAPE